MAEDIKAKLQRITAKSQILVEKYRALQAVKANVDEENAVLKSEISQLQKQLEQSKTEIEYLKLARNISHSHDDFVQSKIILTQMVRDVDKCIAQLTD